MSGLNTSGCAGAVMSIQIFNCRSPEVGPAARGGRAPALTLVTAQEILDLAEAALSVVVELEQRLEQAAERGAQRGLGGDDYGALAGPQHQRAGVERVAVLAVHVEADLADRVEVGQDRVDRQPLVGAAGEVLVDAWVLEELLHLRTSVPSNASSDCEPSHRGGSALASGLYGRRGTFVPNDREFRKRLVAGALSERFGLALLEGDAVAAERVVRDAFDDELPYALIHDAVVAPALHRIGKLWERGEIGVAHEHLATQISLRVLALLRELFGVARRRSEKRVMLAAVEGEQHVVALQMVGDLLEDA